MAWWNLVKYLKGGHWAVLSVQNFGTYIKSRDAPDRTLKATGLHCTESIDVCVRYRNWSHTCHTVQIKFTSSHCSTWRSLIQQLMTSFIAARNHRSVAVWISGVFLVCTVTSWHVLIVHRFANKWNVGHQISYLTAYNMNLP